MRNKSIQPHAPIIACLLFFSGVAALIYQTIWIKQLTLVVGVDVYAVTTGVAAFFAGLAAGSALFGRIADRAQHPLRVYARLEFGIAILAVGTTFALAAMPEVFVALQSRVGIVAWILPFLAVAVPAALMGGTLPPLLAAIHPADDVIGRVSGRLYAANTAGAIAGTLLTVFAIVPAFGIRGAAFTAAALNLVLGLGALAVAAKTAPRDDAGAQAEDEQAVDGARLAMTLYALAGGVAIGYEVIWTQVIVQFLSTRAIAFSIVLATYLFGLVLGSWLYSLIADRVTNRWRTFGLLIGGAGLLALLTFVSLGPWLTEAQNSLRHQVFEWTGSRMISMCARFGLAAAVLVLPSTLLLGAAFPAAARLAVNCRHVGRDVGLVLALNTAIGICGTLITGFVLIPMLGLAGSLGALAVTAAAIGGIAVAREGNFARRSCTGAALLFVASGVFASVVPNDRLAILLTDLRGGTLLSYDEGPAGTVAVIEQSTRKGKFRRLYIQGVSNTGDTMASLRYMRLQALTPLLVHPGEPKSVLVIGLGTGITSGATLSVPSLDRRLCVELLEPVIDAAHQFQGNFGVTHDERVEIRVADGRHELMRSDEQFDVITLEPPPPAAAGVVNLYSRDFYELARERLSDSGILAQWWPINTQSHEDSQSLVRSMLDAFPHVTLWTTEFHEMMLIGSMEPQEFSFSQVSQHFQIPTIAAALDEIGINSPADLLGTWVTGRAGLEAYAEDALPVTDNRPRIEYAKWVRPIEVTWVLPKLMALHTPPPVVASEEEMAQIKSSHQRLANFYAMTRLALGGDREGWKRQMLKFMRDRQPNAYYDFVLPRSR